MVEWNIYSADKEVKEIVGKNVLIKANALFDRAPKKFAKKDDSAQPDPIKLFKYLFQKKIIDQSQINKLARRHRELEEQEDALTMHNQQIPVTRPPVSETIPYVPKTKAESPETIEVNGLQKKLQEEDSSGAIDIFGIVDEEPAPPIKKPVKKAPARKTAKKQAAKQKKIVVPHFEEKWYKFKRELGQGAMGKVDLYLYKKLKPHIPVAVKNVLKELASEEFKLRFLNEQEAATMCIDNSRVARILDVGIDKKGNLRMATEFVEGRTLTGLLDDIKEGKPSAKTMYPRPVLLKLMQELLYGLAGVHENGVVHRDVKPDNIMITKNNEVKITDFGISKIKNKKDILLARAERLNLDDLADEACTRTCAMETKAGTTVGTLRYISPEQIEDCSNVDGRADVYSLGVILYEYFADQPPHSGKTMQDHLNKVLLEIPKSPATIIKKKKEAARKQTGKKKKKMRPLENIPADLDAIIMKALEKKPAKRYRTAKDMADDIERFLNYEPVKARKIGLIEKATRWMAQHRLATSLLGLLLVGGIGAGFAVQHQSAQTREARIEAKLQKKDAALQRNKREKAELAKKLMKQQRDAARREVKGQSVSEEILLGLNRLRLKEGYYDAAREILNDAIKESEAYWKPYLERAKLNATFGKHAEAEKDFKTASQKFKKQWGKGKEPVEIWFEAGMHYGLPKDLGGKGEEDKALEYFERAAAAGPKTKFGRLSKAVAEVIKAKLDPKTAERHLLNAITLSETLTKHKVLKNVDATWFVRAWVLGASVISKYQRPVFLRNTNLPEAKQALEEVVSEEYGEIGARHFLARIYSETGNQEKAIQILSKLIEIQKNPIVLISRGIAYRKQGSLDKAIQDYNAALKIDPANSTAHNNLGSICFDKKEYENARKKFSKAIELNPEDPTAYCNRGNAHLKENNLEEALKDFEKAIKADAEYSKAYLGMGNVKHTEGKYDAAIKYFNIAIRLHPDLVAAHDNKGNAFTQLGRFDEAVQVFTKILQEMDPEYVNAYFNRGIAYSRQSKWSEAILDYTETINRSPKHILAHLYRAMSYQNSNQLDEAIKDYESTISLNKKVWLAHLNLGNILFIKGKLSESLGYFKDARQYAPANNKEQISKQISLIEEKLKRNN